MRYVIDSTATVPKLPVSLDEVKQHIRETSSWQDANLETLYIPAAVSKVSKMVGRALTTQTWIGYEDSFPCLRGPFLLRYPPLQSVTHIKYYDENDVLQTVDPATYQVDTVSAPGRVALVWGEYWPSMRYEKLNAIEIKFVCGYGDVNAVPAELRLAVAMVAAHLYDHREEYTDAELFELPGGVASLISPFQMYEF